MKGNQLSIGIKKFREFINDKEDFLILISRQNNPYNLWHCTCAAMDWIEIAIEYIEKVNLDNLKENGLELYTYISAVDIVFESIKKLHSYFINDGKEPFQDIHSIFEDKRLNLDDNRYFKHIRAAFGAHPIDLIEGRRRERRYSGWPTKGVYKEFDFAVLLYSQNIDEPDIPFGFKCSQLKQFLKTRYDYLENIKDNITKRQEKFKSKKKVDKIEQSLDILKQLEILKQENQARLNSAYYSRLIEDIYSFFTTTFSCNKNIEKINEYKCQLIKGVEEIYINLQNVKCEELNVVRYIEPQFIYENHFGYVFSKLSDNVRGGCNKPLIGEKLIINELKDYIEFEYNSLEELYWLVVIGINVKNKMLN